MSTAVNQQLETFFSGFTLVEFGKNESLISGESEPDGVYYLAEGLVKMVAVGSDGAESTLTILRSPAFFPAGFVLADISNSYFYISLTVGKAYRAPKPRVISFLEEHPEVVWDLARRLTIGISGMLRQVERLMIGTSECKVVNVLLLLSDRFGEGSNADIIIPLPLTHPELAALSGTSRETVTRLLNRLRKRNIISYNRQSITIHDRLALEVICNQA